MNFWPPFCGAGIRITRIARDYSSVDVSMRLRWWNRNYVGTHFGGSLYAMTDPFYMLILIKQLGPDYIVWDKGAAIRFRRPGRGTVHAHFALEAAEVERVRREADRGHKVEPVYAVTVRDDAGEVVATVEKTLHVRRKDRPARPAGDARPHAGAD